MKTYKTKTRRQKGIDLASRDRLLNEGYAIDASGKRLARGWLKQPARTQLLAWAPFWGLMLLGALLRFWNLGDRPLHHDESLHAYYSMHLMWDMENWANCFHATCYHYDPLLHGPFQFHAIALIYKICQLLGVYDHGINNTTVRIAAATLGTVIIGLPYFLRDYIGKLGAWLASFLLAISPSMVYFARFAREDTYMACFTMLLVVSAARYMRDHKLRWLILASLGFSLSYATKEATFLTMVILLSFLGGLIAWELGVRWQTSTKREAMGKLSAIIADHGPLVALGMYLALLAPLAKIAFTWMKQISIYITTPDHLQVADNFVKGLKERTVTALPLIALFIGIWAVRNLLRPRRPARSLTIEERKQRPMLATLVTMPWTHWFCALVAGWSVFTLLYSVLFTNLAGGIGDGVWQGLYYWLQQQQVARGGQPWYYYLMLIPMYEQIGLVFGLAGVVRCLRQPSRFRLFLVYWCLGSLIIYSWAGEKMPWLMIHIMMPMLLLAGIALEPAVQRAINLCRNLFSETAQQPQVQPTGRRKRDRQRIIEKTGSMRNVSALAICGLAAMLLVLTLQNMLQVTYVHAADGPHEMMIYVQTAPEVHLVMSKIDDLDQRLYGGQHKLAIGLMDDATWPFAWYLRDYTNVCLSFPSGCGARAKDMEVIITAGDKLEPTRKEYATSQNGATPAFLFHQYRMRIWWDEGYKPPPCVPSPAHDCGNSPTWGGVGLPLWLTYGDVVPPNAQFNAAQAAQRIWQWWWQRTPFGSVDGSFNMGLLIRNNLGVTP